MIVAADNGEAVIRAFLGSLQPPMEQLTAVFVQSGIIDKRHLDGLVSMPDAEQMDFLRSDLKLNAFQARHIRLALSQRKKLNVC